jgi:dTDP-glucose 4,6-dehydratase
MKILITGGAGFIGSAFTRQAVLKDYQIIVIDNLDYAGDLKRLGEIKKQIRFFKADICEPSKINSIFKKEKPQILVNFAAQTHVDRSIKEPTIFINNNIVGMQVLLEAARKYNIDKFLHISTDEIYGEIEQGEFFEDSPPNPSSPYAASKAAADLLLKSYMRTYKFPGIIVRPCNNYGPWQYPEKLIPLTILKILCNKKIPVYAEGKNVREWLYVEDCARGIAEIMEKGIRGEIYNLGSGEEKQNIEVVRAILNLLNKDESAIEFVKDRPGHDIRYKLNSQKVLQKVGWQPKVRFAEGIKRTVDWCLEHKDWLLSK